MKLRDKIKSEEYLKTYFDEEKNRIYKFQMKLNNNEIREDRILPVKEVMHDIKYHMMIAKYSAGYPIDDVKTDYMEVLQGMPQYWSKDKELSKRINMLSLGILLGIEDKYFDILVKFIEETGNKEYMFDYLINFRKADWEISNCVRYDTVFGWIKEVTQKDKLEAQTFLKEYINKKWYPTHNDFYWYNNHKSKFNTYFGYWSFEAGAIVKVMGLDDTMLKDCKYYPYDLVHYKD
jgi:hypothetical protein